jgi:uncharacterized protein
LRAFTPRDQRAVKAAAETFRQNPSFSTEKVITELGVGEALASVLDEKGSPTIVERLLIAPPAGRVGPITDEQRRAIIASSPVRGRYDQMVDAESAYEMLQKRREMDAESAQDASQAGGLGGLLGSLLGGASGTAKGKGRQPQSMTEMVIKSATRSIASSVGRQVGSAILRGVMGSLLKR